MFNTKPKDITEILVGLDIDLKEAAKYTNFKPEELSEINIKPKDIQAAIDGISYRNLSSKKIPYIAPTISPGPVSLRSDYLEHPQDIFDYYIEQGVTKLIGEMKHMGSNATIYVFKDKESALEYTGQEETEYVISRSGFRFFKNPEVEAQFNKRLRAALDESDYFNRFGIKFAIWNAEILPWNMRSGGLLKREYFPALDASSMLYDSLDKEFKNSELPVREGLKRFVAYTKDSIDSYHEQLHNYCKEYKDINEVTVAPFHLLATDKGTFFKLPHIDHLNHFKYICDKTNNKFIVPTDYVEVDLTSQESMDEAIQWWEDITDYGFEGAIFKTWEFTEANAIPMLKCRGKQYLRIIYGIDYDMPNQMAKHKHRSTKKKRRYHMLETLLNVLSLEKFRNKEDNQPFLLALLALTENDGIDIRL